MRVVYTDPITNNLSVIYPVDGSIQTAIKAVPQGLAYEIVEDNAIPSDRRWRNAWKIDVGSITIDADKAKQIRVAELKTEEKDMRKQAWDAHLDGNTDKVSELSADIIKFSKVKAEDLPSELDKLHDWRP